jgi:hypothetical protein
MWFASTPHILTEVSKLIGLERDLLKNLRRDAIKKYLRTCNERAHDAWMLMEEAEFNPPE